MSTLFNVYCVIIGTGTLANLTVCIVNACPLWGPTFYQCWFVEMEKRDIGTNKQCRCRSLSDIEL